MMTTREQKSSHRGRVALAGALTLVLAAGAAVWSHTAEAGSVGPDVTVIYLGSTSNYGSSNGVRAYSVGTTSCNVGDEPLWWCDDPRPYCEDEQHPVIAQNLYRLKEGRFEQIGMSWLKHGFLSTNSFDPACGSCQGPPNGGDQLGVGCTDTYGSGLNGSRPLGMRSEVNAATGVFPFPFTTVSTSTVIDQRMQVTEADVDPALNPGARYWVEGQYIAADDAASENAFNNASYREVKVSAGSFSLALQGSTVREKAAIHAWKAADLSVALLEVDVPSAPVERFHVARKVSPVAGGWHYEYAIHNLNSDRGARSFSIRFPPGTAISNAGFHDVDHHSGEPFDAADWAVAVDGAAGTVAFSTSTFAADENANALRWGTMFTFWFDAEVSPNEYSHTLGLFKPGSPSAVSFAFDKDVFADGFESGDTTGWSKGAR